MNNPPDFVSALRILIDPGYPCTFRTLSPCPIIKVTYYQPKKSADSRGDEMQLDAEEYNWEPCDNLVDERLALLVRCSLADLCPNVQHINSGQKMIHKADRLCEIQNNSIYGCNLNNRRASSLDNSSRRTISKGKQSNVS